MSVRDEARLAYQAKVDAAEAAARAERRAFRAAAIEAVRAVLVRPNGTTLTTAEAPLTAVHTDMSARLVVVAADNETIHLAAQKKDDGTWVVRLAQSADGDWSQVPESEDIRSLADLWEQVTAARIVA